MLRPMAVVGSVVAAIGLGAAVVSNVVIGVLVAAAGLAIAGPRDVGPPAQPNRVPIGGYYRAPILLVLAGIVVAIKVNVVLGVVLVAVGVILIAPLRRS